MLLDGRRQERVLVARGRCDGWRPRIPSLASMVFQQMPHPLIRHPTFPIPGSPLGCELARASRPDHLRRDPLQSSEPRPGRRCQARQSSSLPLWRVECDWGFVAGQPSWITQAWRFEGLTHVLLLWPPGGGGTPPRTVVNTRFVVGRLRSGVCAVCSLVRMLGGGLYWWGCVVPVSPPEERPGGSLLVGRRCSGVLSVGELVRSPCRSAPRACILTGQFPAVTAPPARFPPVQSRRTGSCQEAGGAVPRAGNCRAIPNKKSPSNHSPTNK